MRASTDDGRPRHQKYSAAEKHHKGNRGGGMAIFRTKILEAFLNRIFFCLLLLSVTVQDWLACPPIRGKILDLQALGRRATSEHPLYDIGRRNGTCVEMGMDVI
jgi:hypothetical protein